MYRRERHPYSYDESNERERLSWLIGAYRARIFAIPQSAERLSTENAQCQYQRRGTHSIPPDLLAAYGSCRAMPEGQPPLEQDLWVHGFFEQGAKSQSCSYLPELHSKFLMPQFKWFQILLELPAEKQVVYYSTVAIRMGASRFWRGILTKIYVVRGSIPVRTSDLKTSLNVAIGICPQTKMRYVLPFWQ